MMTKSNPKRKSSKSKVYVCECQSQDCILLSRNRAKSLMYKIQAEFEAKTNVIDVEFGITSNIMVLNTRLLEHPLDLMNTPRCVIFASCLRAHLDYKHTHKANHAFYEYQQRTESKLRKFRTTILKMKALITSLFRKEADKDKEIARLNAVLKDSRTQVKKLSREVKKLRKIIVADSHDRDEEPDEEPVPFIETRNEPASTILQNWENLKHHLIKKHMKLSEYCHSNGYEADKRSQIYNSWINLRHSRNMRAHPEPEQLSDAEFERILIG